MCLIFMGKKMSMQTDLNVNKIGFTFFKQN